MHANVYIEYNIAYDNDLCIKKICINIHVGNITCIYLFFIIVQKIEKINCILMCYVYKI